MLIADAHLDLSYNALHGRDVLRPAAEQTADKQGIPSVGLPDLRLGKAALICATIFCEPAIDNQPGYHTAQEAFDMAWQHIRWYQQQQAAGQFRFVISAQQIEHAGHSPATETSAKPVSAMPSGGAAALPLATFAPCPSAPLSAILLMEGADAFRTPDDVPAFFEAGVRIVGLAWKRTRMAGGTGAPGSLTDEGVALVHALDRAGIIHDASHLAEESFWQLLEFSSGAVMASHSNCRAIVPSDRQLSDDMIRALIRRGGVIGINFFDRFLLPPEEQGQRRANLSDVVRHVRHVSELAGNAKHVGLGTDMDGGFGRNEIPLEIATSADLPRVADALAAGGFDDEQIHGIMGENWARFFKEHLR